MHSFFVGPWVVVINSIDELWSLVTNMADMWWQEPGVTSPSKEI
jgi:hypothetical protein